MTSDASPATVTIGSPGLGATIALRGAELVGLRDEAGRDLLWDGDPAVWKGQAPLLFPIVGRLKDDTLRVDGQSYPVKQHGIARIATFTLVAHGADHCRLRLDADAATRAAFPFPFTFEITYAIRGRTLTMDVAVTNGGAAVMPVSMGFHPAFRWPLPYGGARTAHAITFEADEPAPIHQVAGGLLSPETLPSPLDGRTLALADALFANDALIWLGLSSRRVWYGVPGRRGLAVTFPLMPDLGIWTKPGAGYVCIEPWSGYASPAGFDGDLADKPGVIPVAAGATQAFGMAVTLDPP